MQIVPRVPGTVTGKWERGFCNFVNAFGSKVPKFLAKFQKNALQDVPRSEFLGTPGT